MRYAREVAFATAEVYARAAEMRGAWDARLEALVVDSVLRGEADETVRSRASALGWESHGRRGGRARPGAGRRTRPGPRVDHRRRTPLRPARRAGRAVRRAGRPAGGRPRRRGRPGQGGRRAWRTTSATGPVVVGPVVPDLVRAQRLGPRRDRRAARRAGLAGRAAPGDQRRPAARAGAGRRRPRPPAAGRRRSTCRWPRPGRRPWRRCRRSSTTAARSRAPPGRCSCTPTPCATGCAGSPSSPGSRPPTRGTPTPTGSR